MDCTRVDEELIAFHLAVLDGATRAAVEAHLTGCARCVSAYLALKRAIDAGEDAVAPSELVRARIRRAAQEQLAKPEAAKPEAAKPEVAKPEAATDAAERKRGARAGVWMMAATAAALLLAAPFAWRLTRVTPAEPAATGSTHGDTIEAPTVPARQTVDTARETPENLAFL